MTDEIEQRPDRAVWGVDAVSTALQQIAQTSRTVTGLDIRISHGGFETASDKKNNQEGILAIYGKILDDVILIRADLLRFSEGARVSVEQILKRIAELGEKVRIAPPQKGPGSGQSTCSVELQVQATPLSYTRLSAFTRELERIDKIARGLQAELPASSFAAADRANRYQGFSEVLRPVEPWCGTHFSCLSDLRHWAQDTMDLLWGGASVAVRMQSPIESGLALAALAIALEEAGDTLGELIGPSVNARTLVDLAGKAPGVISIPVHLMKLVINPHEIQVMLAALMAAGRSVVFTGTVKEYQTVFPGGQASVADPLCPIVLDLPEIEIEALTRFTVHRAGMRHGGISVNAEDKLVAEIHEALLARDSAEQRRLLPLVVESAVRRWINGKPSQVKRFTWRLMKIIRSLSFPSSHC